MKNIIKLIMLIAILSLCACTKAPDIDGYLSKVGKELGEGNYKAVSDTVNTVLKTEKFSEEELADGLILIIEKCEQAFAAEKSVDLYNLTAEIYREYIKINSSDEKRYIGLAKFYRDNGELDKAVKVLDSCPDYTDKKEISKLKDRYIAETRGYYDIDMPRSFEDVPDPFKEPCANRGKLEYFYYDTKYYDKDISDMTKYALIYLPYGYDSDDADTKYDVMYLMHGRDDSPEHFFGTPDNPSENKNIIDNLICGGMRPVIIVACDYYPNNTQVFNGDGDASMTKNFGYEFINDLMPSFESQYNTYAEEISREGFVNSRNHRMFAGFSMGAVTTWYRIGDSLRYCRYFMPMSGSLYWGTEIYTDKQDAENFIPNYLDNAVKAGGYSTDDFVVVSCVGTSDFAKRTLDSAMNILKTSSEYFVFDGSKPNTYYYYGYGDKHDYVATGKYLYNVLPLFMQMIGGSNEE